MREHGTTQKLDPKKLTIYIDITAALINFKRSKDRKQIVYP